MKVYQALQIGDYHVNYCEDYLFYGEAGNNKLVCAVMDGCTMATDSYFAATLVGKLLRKITVEIGYKEFYDSESVIDNIDDYLKSVLRELFKELVIPKNQLLLDRKELLTTLIILVLDKKSEKGVVLTVGDGFVCIDGKITEFDQDNKPDYLGFHLGEDFENWYKSQTQKIFFEHATDVSIATDGISTFAKIKPVQTSETVNPVDFLLIDKTGIETTQMLEAKLRQLETRFGLKPTDDIGLLRIIS